MDSNDQSYVESKAFKFYYMCEIVHTVQKSQSFLATFEGETTITKVFPMGRAEANVKIVDYKGYSTRNLSVYRTFLPAPQK